MTRRERGRPPKPSAERRTVRLELRVTPALRRRIDRAMARDNHWSVSEWLRTLIERRIEELEIK